MGIRSAAFGIAAMLVASKASATETIRLVVDAPCVDTDEVVAEVTALGGSPRLASPEERARRFALTVGPANGGFAARLVVTDLIGQTTEREVAHADCKGAVKSGALLVALALDEDVTTITPAPPPIPLAWPAPAEAPAARREPRQGSGGLVVTGLYGAGAVGSATGSMKAAGVRAYGAVRAFGGSTRFGGALAFASETERTYASPAFFTQSNGWSGRAGAVIGWGAPWNDSVAGFVGEVGVAIGRQIGSRSPRRRTEYPDNICNQSPEFFSSDTCYDTTRAVAKDVFFATPYVAASLVLQVPWRAPIRPVASLGTVMRGGDRTSGAWIGVVAEGGVVWQAW